MGGGVVFRQEQALHRAFASQGPRWSVTSGPCCAGYLLKEAQVVWVGKSQEPSWGPPPLSRQVFSGPNLGVRCRGRAPPTGTSQLSPRAASSRPVKATSSESTRGISHMDVAERGAGRQQVL